MIASVAAAELAENRERLTGARVHRHESQAQPTAGTADARKLARGAPLVGREDDAERRNDDVEGRVRVGQGLCVADVEPDVEIRLGRTGSRAFDPILRDVDSRHTRAGARREQREAAGSCSDIENGFTGLRIDQFQKERLRPHVPSFKPLPSPRRTAHAANSVCASVWLA
jgi:hypothetical protein